MFCSKCGAKNHDDAARCIICGTQLVRPPELQATPTAAPPSPSALPAAPATPPPAAPAAEISTYLVPAILTTLFCCLPFGIVAIVYASSVSSKLQAGDLEGARRAAQTAKTWCWVAFGVGLGLFLLYVVGIAVAVIADL